MKVHKQSSGVGNYLHRDKVELDMFTCTAEELGVRILQTTNTQRVEICPDCGGAGCHSGSAYIPPNLCYRCEGTGKLSPI